MDIVDGIMSVNDNRLWCCENDIKESLQVCKQSEMLRASGTRLLHTFPL